MQVEKIDIDVSGNQISAAVANAKDINNERLHAIHAIAMLEKIAPRAYEHLQRALANDASQVVLSIPAHLIKRSAYANRLKTSFNTPAFTELRDSISIAEGNTQPIIIRPVTSLLGASSNVSPGVDDPIYEIVAGHRRHQCCLELQLPVKALVVPKMTDAEMIIAMHNENHARASLTAWEFGAMIKQCLDQGVFVNRGEMARKIGRDPGDLSRAYSLVTLPEAILQAFATPTALQYKDADLINGALKVNSDAVIAEALRIAQADDKLTRAEVLQLLTAAAQPASIVGSTNIARKVPLRVGEKDVGSIAWDAKGQAVVRFNQSLSEKSQTELQVLLTKLLERESRAAAKRAPKTAKELA